MPGTLCAWHFFLPHGRSALHEYSPDRFLLPFARDPQANVLLTPHVAAGGWKDSARHTDRSQDYENIVHFLEGRPLLHRVV